MTINNIAYIDLQAQWKTEKKDLLKIIDNVMSSGQFVGGKYVDQFEKKLQSFVMLNTPFL